MPLANAGIERREPRERSAFSLIGQLALAAALGVVVLPVALGPWARRDVGAAASPAAFLWLGGAVLATGWLLALAPAFSDLLRRRLAPLPWMKRSDDRPGQGYRPGPVAALLVALTEAALIEATLRAPVHEALGGAGGAIDAIVAGLFAALFIGLALRLYLASAPLVESGAWAALDALIPTIASETGVRFAAAGEARTRAATTRSGRSTPPTRPAPPSTPARMEATRPALAATVPEATRADKAPTVVAADVPTVLAPDLPTTVGGDGSTVIAGEAPTVPSVDATVPAPPVELSVARRVAPRDESARGRPHPSSLPGGTGSSDETLFQSAPGRSADALLLDILAQSPARPIHRLMDPTVPAPHDPDRTREA